jgi:hypothetical protein
MPRPAMRPTQPHTQWVLGLLPNRSSRQDLKLTIPPSSAEIKNVWSCISRHPYCEHDRDAPFFQNKL